jgi:hypothetical protein
MKPKSPVSLGPGVPAEFVTHFGAQCKAAVCGWDRLRLRGTLRPLFSPKWMYGYLCAARVRLMDFRTFAQNLTAQLREAALQAAVAAGRPYRFVRSAHTSKLELAREIAARDRVAQGLVAVFGALEPCLALTVRLDRESGLLRPVVEERKCLHFYHYLQHPVFGLCHVRVQSWLPCTVEVWINGREWLARQMDAAGLGYVQRANCFTHLQDAAAAQRLLDRQHRIDWPKQLGALLAQAHPLHARVTAPLPGLSYYWSVVESEYATDVIFADPAALERVYPRLLQHGLSTFGSVDIMRFLGHVVPAHTGRVNGRFKDELNSTYRHRPEGVRLKHRVGHNTLKMYDKHGQVLRVETTLNAPEVFKVWRAAAGRKRKRWRRLRRTVADLPRRAQISQAANARYLQALAATRGRQPLAETAAPLTQPVRWQGRRYRALNPLAARDADVLALINRGEFTVEGLRNADLQRALFTGPARTATEKRRRSAAAGRWLRLLRAHGLLRKIPGRHRYVVTNHGRLPLTAVLTARQADVEQLTALAA